MPTVNLGGIIRPVGRMIGTVVLVWGVLVALEILFWVRPTAAIWQTAKRRLYRRRKWFYAAPAEYVLRLGVVAIVLTVTDTWGNPITGTSVWGPTLRAALASMAFGLVLGTITMAWFLAKRGRSWQQLLFGIVRQQGHALYILFWVSGVEEFLFRGLLITLLAPQTGAWAIPLSSMANMVWHIPAWVAYAQLERHGMRFRQMLLGGALASLLLGAIYYATGSLFGPIIAHFAGDVVLLADHAGPENRSGG